MDGSYVSVAEQQTYLRFLKFGQREDKRGAFDFRDWRIIYSKDPGTCVAHLGSTTILCSVKVLPKRTTKTNQTHGLSRVDLSLTTSSYTKFQPSRKRLRTLRKQLRQHIKSSLFWSKCVDDETLCISRGKAVFQVCVSVEVIHADGNLFDAACLAAVSCLLNTQRPQISVDGDRITALNTYEKTPVPLQVNHIPVSTTFGFQSASHFLIVDPTGKEEIVLNGSLTMVVNQNGEICGTYKQGIHALPVETIQRCAEIAALRSKDVAAKLRELSEEDAMMRAKNQPVDFIQNLRRSLGSGLGGGDSITAKAVELGLFAPVVIEPEPVIIPKREGVKFRPDEEHFSEEDEGEINDDDSDDDNDDSEEETIILELNDLG